MNFQIAMTNDNAAERSMGFASVFSALGPVTLRPNAVNRFAYSRREVLFAM
jgi:hypothetical protein